MRSQHRSVPILLPIHEEDVGEAEEEASGAGEGGLGRSSILREKAGGLVSMILWRRLYNVHSNTLGQEKKFDYIGIALSIVPRSSGLGGYVHVYF